MNPQLSPDREWPAFYPDRGGDNKIFKLELVHPEQVVQLTQDGENAYDPRVHTQRRHYLRRRIIANIPINTPAGHFFFNKSKSIWLNYVLLYAIIVTK
jgi:hypothetical protein